LNQLATVTNALATIKLSGQTFDKIHLEKLGKLQDFQKRKHALERFSL